eukprot:TRINITY_DN18643_c0_g1_i1.p1 TRINITY_DN18643_c0_g1~~TRINITY_DN18643_c0_g1_i1.p1  ORF type:complete len:757 (+),score=140.08 TRINITY_DN18643_c0_g1_i1:50-2272(+)
MSLSPSEAAKVKVLTTNHQVLSAARDKATEAQWQKMSWEDKLRTIETIDSDVIQPIGRPKLTISDVMNPAHAGVTTNQHTVSFHDTVVEIFNIGVKLQQPPPDVFPDYHLPGQGHRENGVKKSTFTKMAKLMFEGIREEQVEVIWDEALNQTSVPGWADYKEASLQEIKEMLETLAVHHAMTPVALVAAAREASLVLQRELRANSVVASPQSLQVQLVDAEEGQKDSNQRLQQIELDNIRLQQIIADMSGDLDPKKMARYERESDITQLTQYLAEHSPFLEREFTVLVDLTIPSVRHAESISKWRENHSKPDQQPTAEDILDMLTSLSIPHGLTPEDLSHQLSKINVFGNTPQRDDIYPYSFDPMVTPERMSMQKKIDRLHTSTAQFNARYEVALAENEKLQERHDDLSKKLKEKEEAHIAYINSLKEPDYPPPEVPATLYVSMTGGWADVRRNGDVLPGKYGPQKVEGRYSLQEGSWDPGTDEPSGDSPVDCSAIWTCDNNEGKSKIVSINGIWVVTHPSDEQEDQHIITCDRPHNGWRPHEIDGAHPFHVVGDISNTWHVTISAEEYSKPHHGLCKVCLPKHNIYKLALYHEQDGVQQANSEVEALKIKHQNTERDTALLSNKLLVYQDNTEAPPVRRSDGIQWGTEGRYHDVVSPKWTGGRPPEVDALYKLPIPRIRLRDSNTESRSSAVSALIKHYSEPSSQTSLYPTSTQAPPHVRRPVPVPHLHTQLTYGRQLD